MKTIILKISLITCFAFSLISCNKEEVLKNEDLIAPELQSKPFEFTYNGVKYSSIYYLDQNENPIFDNEEVAELYNKFDQLEIAIIDDDFFLFDEWPEWMKVDTEENQKIQSKSYDLMGTCYFYDLQNYSGYSFSENVYSSVTIPNLGSYIRDGVHWNNRITSLAIDYYNTGSQPMGIRVQLFEDYNYTGKLLQIYARNPGQIKKFNLNDYYYQLFRTWSDKTSSLRIFYTEIQ